MVTGLSKQNTTRAFYKLLQVVKFRCACPAKKELYATAPFQVQVCSDFRPDDFSSANKNLSQISSQRLQRVSAHGKIFTPIVFGV
jgi:hypothetical protein